MYCICAGVYIDLVDALTDEHNGHINGTKNVDIHSGT